MSNQKWNFKKYLGRASYNNLQIAVYDNDETDEIKLVKEDMRSERHSEAIYMSYDEYAEAVEENSYEDGLQLLVRFLNKYFKCEMTA